VKLGKITIDTATNELLVLLKDDAFQAIEGFTESARSRSFEFLVSG
jgi:hypothetical protein